MTQFLRVTTRKGAAALAGALLLLGWTTLHTDLEASNPPKDAELAEPPAQITLDYTTDVQVEMSRIIVTTGAGEAVGSGKLSYLADDRHDVLAAPLPARMGPGVYTVAWTTAGPDGHALAGEFTFSVLPPTVQEPQGAAGATAEVDSTDVTAGAPAAGAEASEPDPNSGRAATATRWLFYLGVIGILGAVAFRFLVLPQVGRGGELKEVTQAAQGTLWRIVGMSAVALLLAAPFRLWFQARSFFGDDALGGLGVIATQGPWGKGWLLHLALGLLVGTGFLLARPQGRRAAGWGIIAIGALLLPAAPLLTGHAWGRSPQVIAIAADFLHVLAAGTWVGGLFCLLFAGLPALKAHGVPEGSGQPGLPGMVAAFSRVALASVCLLVVSGATNTWLHVETLSQVWTTAWGKVLLVKLAVVAGVLGLGFYNWRFVRPALAETPRPGLLKGPAALELILGAVAIAATSFLVVQPLN